jgi:hypothetical protein
MSKPFDKDFLWTLKEKQLHKKICNASDAYLKKLNALRSKCKHNQKVDHGHNGYVNERSRWFPNVKCDVCGKKID